MSIVYRLLSNDGTETLIPLSDILSFTRLDYRIVLEFKDGYRVMTLNSTQAAKDAEILLVKLKGQL